MARVSVNLTIEDLHAGLRASWQRINSGHSKGLNHATTYQRTWLERCNQELIGALGEVAVSRYFGIHNFVCTLGTFHHTPDCDGIEVRSTDNQRGGLIIRDNDNENRPYVLALVEGPTVILAGWLYGLEAKQPIWERNPNAYRPCWIVPQSALRHVDTLLALRQEY